MNQIMLGKITRVEKNNIFLLFILNHSMTKLLPRKAWT